MPRCKYLVGRWWALTAEARNTKEPEVTYPSMETKSLILCLVFIGFQARVTETQAQAPPAFDDRLNTVAGELRIAGLDESCKFNVTLNDKLILKTDCQDEANAWSNTPIPIIHTYYKSSGVLPFDEVVLLQMGMLGNACDGGPLLFLGLKQDKTFALSESIDFLRWVSAHCHMEQQQGYGPGPRRTSQSGYRIHPARNVGI